MAMANKAVWQQENSEKRDAVQQMFTDIAPTYDLLNSILSFRLHHRWRSTAVAKLQLKPGAKVLDLCSGTGDFIPPIRKAVGMEGQVLAVDFCYPMLRMAAKKKLPAEFALGDACNLSLRDNSFDGVTVGWGIRNVPDIDQAHREILRVLKPGGRFVSVDMARSRNKLIGGVSTWVFNTLVPKIGALFGKTQAYKYLPKSTEKFMSREELVESMKAQGFTDVHYQDMFFGNICMHWGTKP